MKRVALMMLLFSALEMQSVEQERNIIGFNPNFQAMYSVCLSGEAETFARAIFLDTIQQMMRKDISFIEKYVHYRWIGLVVGNEKITYTLLLSDGLLAGRLYIVDDQDRFYNLDLSKEELTDLKELMGIKQ